MTQSTLSVTTDYYATHFTTRLVRMGLGASQRIWPALAARVAHGMFCTPLPLKWLNRRNVFSGDWAITQWPFDRANLTVYATDNTDQPVVLLVHGWGGHAAQMLPLARKLRGAGLNPVIVEMPAHGRSAGARSSLPQFARAVDYVAARLKEEGRMIRAVVAHSLGANASAYALSRGVAAERLVLLAPPASPLQYTRLFAHAFALRESTRAAMQRRVEAREAITMSQFEPAAVGSKISVETLVVHDRGDRINPFSDGEAFAQAIDGARFIATEGLGHRRVLSDERIMQTVTEFVAPGSSVDGRSHVDPNRDNAILAG
jgi:pimeloyl-ACP methyl ester carboxylesterase